MTLKPRMLYNVRALLTNCGGNNGNNGGNTKNNGVNLNNTDQISKMFFLLILPLKSCFLHRSKQKTTVTPSQLLRPLPKRTPSLV